MKATIRNYRIRAGAAASAMLLAFGAMPASATSGLLERIEERANLRTAVIRLIEGEDREMAIAAFEEAMLMEDPEMRLSIMQAALEGDDVRLRKAALRHFLHGRPELRLEVLLPDRPDAGQQLLFDEYHGYRFFQLAVDSQNDIISFDQRQNQYWSGQLVEDGVDLTFRRTGNTAESINCTASLRAAPGLQLTGQLDCAIRSRNMLQKSEGIERAVVPLVVRIA